MSPVDKVWDPVSISLLFELFDTGALALIVAAVRSSSKRSILSKRSISLSDSILSISCMDSVKLRGSEFGDKASETVTDCFLREKNQNFLAYICLMNKISTDS